MEGIKLLNFSKLWQFLNDRLKTQRTYIIPSRLGFYYAFLCLFILVVAFINSNNIAYFCGFMLTSLGIITIFQTNFNMDRIQLHALPFGEVEAEIPTTMRVLIENRSTQPVYHLKLRLRDGDSLAEIAYVGPHQQVEADLVVVFPKRGEHLPPLVIAETYFPFGFLKAWKLLRPTQKVLVYPHKKGLLILPSKNHEGADNSLQSAKEYFQGHEFLGHRDFQPSDSLRQIDWKAYARRQKLYVKLFESDENGVQVLAWEATQFAGDLEARLSQLAQWIGVCQRQKSKYLLELPHWRSQAEASSQHTTNCLTQLALFRNEVLPSRPA